MPPEPVIGLPPETTGKLQAAVRDALPAGTAASLGLVAGNHLGLLGAEVPPAMNMAEKRRQEFVAGRAHARAALAMLGLPPKALSVGPNRAPVWPAGFVGSISHAGGLAAAVVAPARLFTGIGIDLEPATPVDGDLLEHICRPEELARIREILLPAIDQSPEHAAKLVFSAKESVYKCVAPRLGIFLEFADVEIRLEPDGQTFSARGHGPARGHITSGTLRGRFVGLGGYWVTMAWQDA